MFIAALDISLRVIAAAAAIGLVLVVFRVRSGAARHAAWSAVLVAMLMMPVLTAIVPKVDVPVPAALALDLGAVATDDSQHALPIEDGGRTDLADPTVASFTVYAGRTDRTLATPAPATARLVTQLAPAVFVLYLAGLVVLAVRLAGGWRLARRLVAGASPVALHNPSPVLESAAIATPLTTGVFSPRVLLPVSWREWPEDKLAAVLAHENAHIARRDALVAFLAQLNRAIFWFHPLAWWLERTLAVTSEHACDEAAARQVGHPRRYAEVLLDMAEAVSRGGRRVSWQALGVDGSGLLGARIDRILKGDVMARMPAAKRIGVAAGCAAVLVLAIACRQQIQAEPLRPDPEVQKEIDKTNARMKRHRDAVAMTPADAAALEKALESDPNNVETREKLIIFYDQAGKVSWEEKLAGIRKHSLWRLQHLPDTDLWIPHISKRYDPEGYAEAKRLWLEQTSKPDVTAKTLGRAAAFMTAYDKPVAEELLLRAQKMEPAGPWAERLGLLYARAIVGTIDPRYGTTAPDEAKSPFADEARRKLDATTDASVLAIAGHELAVRYAQAGTGVQELGRRYIERAAALDPRNARARSSLEDLRSFERSRQIAAQLQKAAAQQKADPSSDAMYAAVSALPESDRLFYLPRVAATAYMSAEYIEYVAKEKPPAQLEASTKQAAAGFARSRQYATDALTLAERHRQAPDYGDVIYGAHTTLAVVALKDGDRQAAVRHMASAAAAPLPAGGRASPEFGLRPRLVEYLLREGERDSVVQYLEKSAARFPRERERLVADAKQIRAGVMPSSYQRAEARR